MGIEIERKFLVTNDAWRKQASRMQRMRQGYLIDADVVESGRGTRCSVRVRIAGESAWLNIKSTTLGIARDEYEYAIPLADGERMLRDFCNGLVEKVRHYVTYESHVFEVDEFFGDNAGLIVAELELPAPNAPFARPDWLGQEVTDRQRYYNLNLLAHPYSRWSESERAGK